MTAYFKLPKAEHLGANWFTQTLEAEQRQLGMSDDDIARLMMLIHWGYVPSTAFSQATLIYAINLSRWILICERQKEQYPASHPPV